MQPNGSMPPMKEEGTGWDSQLWSGISRGIWFVLTGCSGAWGEGKVCFFLGEDILNKGREERIGKGGGSILYVYLK